MRVLPALLACLAALAFGTSPGYAFDPPNVRHWPGSTPASSPMVTKVSQTATMTWEAVDQYGWPGWESVVARSLDTGSSDPQSLGNVLNSFLAQDARGQIKIRKMQAGELPDIKHYAVSTAFLEAKCGSGFATACVQLLASRPVPAWYKAAAMILWPYVSEAAVVRHETFHALARACDQYRGGCPRASDGVWEGQVSCTGNPDSLMDCGGAARTVTRFDYETFVGAYPPETPFLQVRPIVYPYWDGQRWQFEDGFSFSPNQGCGDWYDPEGRHAFGTCDDSWGGRHVVFSDEWLYRGTPVFKFGRWYQVP